MKSVVTGACCAVLLSLSSVARATGSFGAAFQFVPTGEFQIRSGAASTDFDTEPAYGFNGFVDFDMNEHLSLGFGPRVFVGLKTEDSNDDSITQLDVLGRVTGKLPVSDRVTLFLQGNPGYSILFLPEQANDLDDPAGFVLDLAAGARIALAPRAFLLTGLGYVLGFQEISQQGVSFDARSRLLTLTLGVGVMF